MLFDSLSVDFDFEFLVQPNEADISVPAENCHDRHVPSVLQALLEVLIGARGMCRIWSLAGMAVKVGQESVAELLSPVT